MSEKSSGKRPFRPFAKPGKPFKGRGGRELLPPAPLDPDKTVLYGWHPVAEAIRNKNRVILKLLATDNAARKLEEEGLTPMIEPEIVSARFIDRLLTADAVHQGLFAECEPLESPDIDSLGEDATVLVLDQITDPHNVGAILRSAAAFGVNALVVTNRHSPEATGVLAKAASGALEHVPIIGVPNLARGLDALRDAGFLLVGLDSEGPADLANTPLRKPLALVLGAEGKGLRQLTRTTCDVLARIDLPGAIHSLNVSNAAAITLYAAHLRFQPTNKA